MVVDEQIERMSLAEYNNVHCRQGLRTRYAGSVCWTRVRPFFYRPTLAFGALNSGSVIPPCRWFGGYQYVVRNHADANSTINFRVYDDSGSYSLETQKSAYRRQVRRGAEVFSVRRIRSVQEAGEAAHRVYLSFYGRTQYTYLSTRVRREQFDKWLGALFTCPKTIVLGAYLGDELRSIAVCYWVDEVLLLATFFSDTESLRYHVADLMLHVVRELAAGQKGITKVVSGTYAGGVGVDEFYILRGFRIERKPARFVIRPERGRALLETLWPQQYQKLTGRV